jgi:DNA-binding IscR family transcriptional regulator
MISKKMKYALKVLVEMTKTTEDCIAAIEIAEKANVPYKFLEQYVPKGFKLLC